MPALVKAVERLVRAPSLDDAVAGLTTFNEAQTEDERAKAAFLITHPNLTEAVFALEDNRLLRGSLVAFDLDAQSFASRAASFAILMRDINLWPTLTAALLAVGDYSRQPNARSFRFGSPVEDRWWRELLTGTKRSNLGGTAAVLGDLLDIVSSGGANPEETLREIRNSWLATRDEFDWRYYFIKYDAMREGRSGIYFAEGGRMGFQLSMLNKTS